MGELFKLQQIGTVSDYYLKFMALANRSEGLSNEVVLNCFLSGLNVDIRRDVIAQRPTTLIRVVSLSKLYEEKYQPVNSNRTHNYSHRYSLISAHTANFISTPSTAAENTTQTSLPPLLPSPNTLLRNNYVKKISPAEMQLRREKGL